MPRQRLSMWRIKQLLTMRFGAGVTAGPRLSRLVNALATSPGPHQSTPAMIPVRFARIT